MSTSSIGRGRPVLLYAALMLGLISQGLAFTAFVAALPQLAESFGPRGKLVAQMTMSVAALGLMLGALGSGWVLERLGTRLMLLVSTLCFGLAGAGGVFLRGTFLLLASRFVVGVAAACMATTCLWGIGAEYQDGKRARALGVSAALSNLGALATTVLGGYLAQVGGWRLAFVQYPVFGALGFVLVWLSLRQVKPAARSASGNDGRVVVRLLPFYLLAALLFAVMFMATTQFAFLLEMDGIGSPSSRSLFIGLAQVIGASTAVFYGLLQRRLTASGAFGVGLCAMAVGLAVAGWGVHPRYAAVAAVLMGIYIGTIGPYVYHAVVERTNEGPRGRAIGLLNAFCFLGGFLNPPVFVALARQIGFRHVFFAVALLLALLFVSTAARRSHARTALP